MARRTSERTFWLPHCFKNFLCSSVICGLILFQSLGHTNCTEPPVHSVEVLRKSVGFFSGALTQEAECAPQCKVFGPSSPSCQELSTTKPGQADCLILPRASAFVHVLTETIVGVPLAGKCNSGSQGGCSEYSPYDAVERDWGDDWPPFGYSMMGRVRLNNFRAAIEEVNRKRIPGSILELGVWRGGGMLLAAAVNKESRAKRKLYLFDAFETITSYGPASEYLSVKQEAVLDAFKLFDLLDDNLHFRVGKFSSTVPNWDPSEQISVLRVDGNFYDSYQDAMYYCYESVAVGGIVILDDVLSHQAVSQFWADFNTEQDLGLDLVRIDRHSAWFRKNKAVKLDWRHFRAPTDANIDINLSDGLYVCPERVQNKTRGQCHPSWKM